MNPSKNIKDCYEIDCEGEMVEKGETGRQSQYLDTDGNTWIKPEIIYQCRKCKNIEITYE